jgi:hypothetical protein
MKTFKVLLLGVFFAGSIALFPLTSNAADEGHEQKKADTLNKAAAEKNEGKKKDAKHEGEKKMHHNKNMKKKDLKETTDKPVTATK